MIKAKLHEVRDAFRAFSSIGENVLPPKAAYRVGRLIAKLRTELKAFEETQQKLFLDAGGLNENGGISLKSPERKDGEAQADFDARADEHRKKINELNENLQTLLDEEVEINYDKIPLSLFENDKQPEKSAQLKPVDLANAEPFIQE